MKPGTTAIFLCEGARPEDEAGPAKDSGEGKKVGSSGQHWPADSN